MSPVALSLALLAAGIMLVVGTVVAQKLTRRLLLARMPDRPSRAAAWSVWIGLGVSVAITLLATHVAGVL